VLRTAAPLSKSAGSYVLNDAEKIDTWVLPGFLPARISATRFVTGGRPASSCFTSGAVFSCAVCQAVNRETWLQCHQVCRLQDMLP
jgi:hypothetical protein